MMPAPVHLGAERLTRHLGAESLGSGTERAQMRVTGR